MINLNKPADFTTEQVQAWEAKDVNGRKIEAVEFDSDVTPDRPARFWITRPNRLLMNAVAEAADKNAGKANDMMLNGCILAGDVDQLEKDDLLYFGLLKEVTALFEAKKKR